MPLNEVFIIFYNQFHFLNDSEYSLRVACLQSFKGFIDQAVSRWNNGNDTEDHHDMLSETIVTSYSESQKEEVIKFWSVRVINWVIQKIKRYSQIDVLGGGGGGQSSDDKEIKIYI